MSDSRPDISSLYAETVKLIGLVDRDPVPFVVPTGSFLLNRALGIGGYPAGRIIEIYGPESSGKTTLGIMAMVQAQRMGLPVGVCDAENAFSDEYARDGLGLQGFRNEDWLYAAPECGEDVIDTVILWLERGIKLVLVDSVAAMTPKAELEGETGEAFMGLQARMMGQGLRKLVSRVAKANAVLIFINQTRQKIGVMVGSGETTTGGKALPFYSTIRLDVKAIGDLIKTGEDQIGRYSVVLVKKNKLSAPHKKVSLPIIYGKGVSQPMELLDLMLVEGLITKRSSFFYYLDEKIGAGRVDTLNYIESNYQMFLDAYKTKMGGRS